MPGMPIVNTEDMDSTHKPKDHHCPIEFRGVAAVLIAGHNTISSYPSEALKRLPDAGTMVGQFMSSYKAVQDRSSELFRTILQHTQLTGVSSTSPKQGNGLSHLISESSSGNKEAKEYSFMNGLHRHISDILLLGLGDTFPVSISDSKLEWPSGKDKGQRHFFMSFFQVIMENCLLATSSVSKHAGRLVPWINNSSCTLDDSDQRFTSAEGHKFLMSVAIEDWRFSNCIGFSKGGFAEGRKQIKYSKLASSGFARVQGDPNAIATTSTKEEATNQEPASQSQKRDLSERDQNPMMAVGLLKFPLPIERFRSTLSGISLTELMELVPQIGKAPQTYPDKKKLFSVQDFFRYTEAEGRRFFEELDRDNDGQVTLEDVEVAMRKRRLPQRYAREFLQRTRKNWFAKSFGWGEFLSLMEQKEPMMLRAYNSLSLSKSGTLQKGQVLASLRSAGLPATEENAAAMMRCLDTDAHGSIAYGHFRNFMLLLPPERLGDDPRMVWFEAATVVPMAPPVAEPAESVLKSALAGGLACALSTSLMHPIDTMKTRVQASSTLSFPELISKLPEIGVRGLYRGSVPAILGQFSSHGLRTGIFEASKILLKNVAPNISELQVQSLASFCSTVLGTAVRIPCEVLKQRLQAGMFNNVGEAIVGTWQQDGPQGLFRGTGATLCREVPFYVAGMGIYAEAKKAMQQLLNRELVPWETIAVGAVSGGLAAVCTTPFDVMKTRTMTAASGMPTTMSTIAITILREEGVLGLFKGAVPRFFWIAPLGAMNFAGYELAKRAMEKKDDHVAESDDMISAS